MTKSSLVAAAVSLGLLLGGSTVAWSADGAEVYKAQCAKCHGETGDADTPVAKTLKVPPLKGDADVQKMSIAEITQEVKENKKHPPTVKSLSDADIEAAAGYAKELAGK
ncbi:MAG TPA: c-type cytochrome [Candidatus Binatia bacterium]